MKMQCRDDKMTVTAGLLVLISGLVVIMPAGAQSLYPGNATPLAPSSITSTPPNANAPANGSSLNSGANGLSNGAIGPSIDPRSGATIYGGYRNSSIDSTSGSTTPVTPPTLNNGITNPDTGLNYGQSTTPTDQPSSGTLGYGSPALSGPAPGLNTNSATSGTQPGVAAPAGAR